MCDNNSSESNKKYDPYEEYVKDKVSESEKQNGELPSPMPDDDSQDKKSSEKLAKIGFFLSIASLLCCCCASWQITLAGSLMALAFSICSAVFASGPKRFNAFSVAGIVISIISIISVLLLIYFYLSVYPDLMSDPNFRDLYEQLFEQLEQESGIAAGSEL